MPDSRGVPWSREAVEKYTQAINMCPAVAAYYSKRATCFQKMNRYDDAVADCRRSIETDPSFVKGYLKLAQALRMKGDLKGAIQTINVRLSLLLLMQ